MPKLENSAARAGAADASRSSLAAHLIVWLAVPVSELFVARGIVPSPAPWQWAAEFAAFATLAVLQWRFAEERWLRTLLWPPLFVVLTGLAVAGPTAPLAWQLFYLAGLVLLVTSIMKDLGAKLRVPFAVALVLALAAPVANRALDLDTLEGQISAGFGGIEGSSSQLSHELAGCPDGPVAEGPGGPPIVVISVDTLRADAARTMKSWQRLAMRGAWWPSALSSSSWTLPATATLQTGRSVAAHGADCILGGGCQGIFPSVRTLAEELASRGYRTAAVTANPWVTRSTGLSRGFQTFLDMAGVPPLRLTLLGPPAGLASQDSKTVVDEAIAWLQRAPQTSFYLWVHLLGPHMPYSHSEDPQMQAVTGDELRTGGITTPEFRESVRKAYDEEVAYNDREILRLLDAMHARGVLATSYVVLTSDHGEEFWEHGGIEHGHSHHGVVTEVPLVLYGPDIPAGARQDVASLADVAPTLAAIAGAAMEGVDLRQPVPPERVATAFGNLYGGPMRSARDTAERVIGSRRGLRGERWERFDLQADPEEQTPLAADPSSRVYREASTVEGPAAGKEAGVNRDALRSLGYAQ